MNTPKEIAIELVDKFIEASVVVDDEDNHHHPRPYSLAKQCAIICVNEILKILDAELGDPVEHWQQVIQEINNP